MLRVLIYAPLIAACLASASCVTINATPEKPIEVKIDVAITQTIVVALRDDARQLLENGNLF